MNETLDPLEKYVGGIQKQVPGLRLVRRVDSGNSATVYQVQINSRDFALKIYDPKYLTGANRAIELRRIAAQKALKGHSCQPLVGIEEADVVGDTAFLLMEYVPWPPLSKRLEEIPRGHIRSIVSKVAHAAEYLESKGLVHRDIKPANILVSDNCEHVRLVDLGVIRPIDSVEVDATDQGVQRPFVATAQYSSPEYLFRLVEPTPEMWRALSYYQLGGVLHDLITREPLFQAAARTENRYALAMAVYREVPVIRSADVEAELVALARQCLLKDHVLRLKQVSWARFAAAPIFDADAARARLGLKSGGTNASASLYSMDARHHALALKRALQSLRDTLSGVIADEGYPAPKYALIVTDDYCYLQLDLQLGVPTGEYSDFAAIVHVAWAGEAGGAIQLSMGAAIGDDREKDALESIRPIAVTDADGMAEDLAGPLRSVLSNELLRYYSAASADLSSGRSKGATVILQGSDESRT